MFGRMLFIGLSTNDRNIIKRLIKECHVGGFILYSKNYRNYEEMIELIHYIKHLATLENYTILIGIDQEGYRVNRLPKDFINLKSPYSLHNDLNSLKVHAQIIANILSSSGIQVNFAPVLDIKRFSDQHAIGDRALGIFQVMVLLLLILIIFFQLFGRKNNYCKKMYCLLGKLFIMMLMLLWLDTLLFQILVVGFLLLFLKKQFNI